LGTWDRDEDDLDGDICLMAGQVLLSLGHDESILGVNELGLVGNISSSWKSSDFFLLFLAMA